jgi:hypothetical protein
MNQTCTIEGCEAHATVKGLCAKHYMRIRRHGDPNTVKSAGAPRSKAKAFLREEHPAVPTRTFDRYHSAMRKLVPTMFFDEKIANKVRTEATRPNGTLNVNRFAGFADRIALVVDKELRRLGILTAPRPRKKKLLEAKKARKKKKALSARK